MAPNRRSGPSSSNNNENPNVATVIAQQLQAIITQVANNANNANNGVRWKGGAIALLVGNEKMENVIDNIQARGRVAQWLYHGTKNLKHYGLKNSAQVMKRKSWRIVFLETTRIVGAIDAVLHR
ncbi:hypothetical protein Tco_1475485 [Tanacetum coccineum]